MRTVILFFILMFCQFNVYTQNRKPLTYHLVNGDQIVTTNVRTSFQNETALIYLNDQAYNVSEIRFVTNQDSTERILYRTNPAQTSIEIYRRHAAGKLYDLYADYDVEIMPYPYRQTKTKIKYTFEDMDGELKPITYKNVAPILAKYPEAIPYLEKANTNRSAATVAMIAGGAITLAGLMRTTVSDKGSTGGAVFALGPICLLLSIPANINKDKQIQMGLDKINGF